MTSPGVGAATPVGAGDRPPGQEFLNRSFQVFDHEMVIFPGVSYDVYMNSDALPNLGNFVTIAGRGINYFYGITYRMRLQGSYDGEAWQDIDIYWVDVSGFTWASTNYANVDHAFVRLSIHAIGFGDQGSMGCFDAWIAFGSN